MASGGTSSSVGFGGIAALGDVGVHWNRDLGAFYPCGFGGLLSWFGWLGTKSVGILSLGSSTGVVDKNAKLFRSEACVGVINDPRLYFVPSVGDVHGVPSVGVGREVLEDFEFVVNEEADVYVFELASESDFDVHDALAAAIGFWGNEIRRAIARSVNFDFGIFGTEELSGGIKKSDFDFVVA